MKPQYRLARLALALLLLLAWLDPPIGPHSGPVLNLLVVVDDSASLSPQARTLAWNTFTDFVATLHTDSRMALVRCADAAVLQRPLMSLDRQAVGPSLPAAPPALNPDESNLAAGLKLALTQSRPGTKNLLILISDGHETQGDATEALRQAEAAAIPALLLGPQPAPPGMDAWIAELHMNEPVRIGTSRTLRVRLNSTLPGQAQLLVAHNGEWFDPRAVELLQEQAIESSIPIRFNQPGLNRIQLQLQTSTADILMANNTASLVVQVNGPGGILHVGNPADASLLELALSGFNQPVQRYAPADLPRDLAGFTVPGLVILDDIAANALDPAQWKLLSKLVTELGAGLLVLAGPNSVQAGGYRDTQLEALLPVTMEPPTPEQAAAVQFVIDTSGSMLAPSASSSALAMARQAVQEAAARLSEVDEMGLIQFDETVRKVLPLSHYDNPGAALQTAWPSSGGGGTHLAPALALALQQLQASSHATRLLVLITDGQLQQDNLADLQQQIAAADVRPLILAMSEDEDALLALGRLAQAGAGQLLPVNDTSLIPTLLRTTLDSNRQAVIEGDVTPQVVAGAEFLHHSPLPHWTAYVLTRPRAGAQVLLSAANGDPLLIRGRAGAGQVMMVPAGFNQWAEPWRGWTGWQHWLTGLNNQLQAGFADPDRWLELESDATGLKIKAEVATPGGDWTKPVLSGELHHLPRNGKAMTLDFMPAAPGQSVAAVAELAAGHYQLLLETATGEWSHAFTHRPPVEHIDPRISPLLARTSLQSWRELETLTPRMAGNSLQPWLSGLVAALYMLLILLERRG